MIGVHSPPQKHDDAGCAHANRRRRSPPSARSTSPGLPDPRQPQKHKHKRRGVVRPTEASFGDMGFSSTWSKLPTRFVWETSAASSVVLRHLGCATRSSTKVARRSPIILRLGPALFVSCISAARDQEAVHQHLMPPAAQIVPPFPVHPDLPVRRRQLDLHYPLYQRATVSAAMNQNF